MQTLESVRHEFFERLGNATESALLLDYDGTLAPFVEQRDQAVPYPGVPELIGKIMHLTPTRVVIVSGRSASEVKALLGIESAPEIWGAHGMERIRRDGTRYTEQIDARCAHAIHQALDWAASMGLQKQVERKPGGIALHWRGMAVERQAELREQAKAAMLPLTRSTRLFVSEFDGGIELRVRDRNKGHVIKEILREMGDVPMAYLGDDRTDEDAFRALRDHGLTVLVRPEFRPTSAELWIQPPQELMSFLEQWLKVGGGTR